MRRRALQTSILIENLSEVSPHRSTLKGLPTDSTHRLYPQISTLRPLPSENLSRGVYPQRSSLRTLSLEIYTQRSTFRGIPLEVFPQRSTHTGLQNDLPRQIYHQTFIFKSTLKGLLTKSIQRNLLSEVYPQGSTLKGLPTEIYSHQKFYSLKVYC